MRKKSLSLLILLITSSLFLSSCATYKITDNRIRVHYIEQNEKAPYNGYLLNPYTYKALKGKAKQCGIK